MPNDISDIGSYVVAAVSAFLAALSAYRYKQAKGSSNLNDFMSDIGGGSFTHLIFSKLRQLIWGALQILFGCIALFAAIWPSADHKVSSPPPAVQSAPSEINQSSEPHKRIEKVDATVIEAAIPKTQPSLDGEAIKNQSTSTSLTKQQVFELEKTHQYHGDDPIVRRRLGLPEVASKDMPE